MVLILAEKMAAELTILREEERMLMRIASKLNDQLNRLKVSQRREVTQLKSLERLCLHPTLHLSLWLQSCYHRRRLWDSGGARQSL